MTTPVASSRQTAARPRRGTVFEAIRAFGVMSGGPAMLVVLVLASIVLAARALFAADTPPWPTVTALIATAGYLLVLRPWSRRWGTRAGEVDQPLPGDELITDPGIEM